MNSLTSLLTFDELDLLAKSRISTFEFRPEDFAHDRTGRLRAATGSVLKAAGKHLRSCHIPFSPLDDVSSPDEEIRQYAFGKLLRQLDEAFFFGCEFIVLHPSTELRAGNEQRPIRVAQLRKSIHEILPGLEARKLRLTLEYLPRRCLGNSVPELLEIIRDFPESTVGICLDVNHIMGEYAALPSIVEELGSRLFTLHISDYDGIDEKHLLPGEGIIDWNGLISALKRIEYSGPFNYECRLSGQNIAERIFSYENNFQQLFSQQG